nr:Rdx family protein [Bacillus sp. FJAT-44742]
MSFADKLLDKYRGAVSAVELITSSGGAFEVTVDGEKVYSKLEQGSFPDEDQLIEEIAKFKV